MRSECLGFPRCAFPAAHRLPPADTTAPKCGSTRHRPAAVRAPAHSSADRSTNRQRRRKPDQQIRFFFRTTSTRYRWSAVNCCKLAMVANLILVGFGLIADAGGTVRRNLGAGWRLPSGAWQRAMPPQRDIERFPPARFARGGADGQEFSSRGDRCRERPPCHKQLNSLQGATKHPNVVGTLRVPSAPLRARHAVGRERHAERACYFGCGSAAPCRSGGAGGT